MVVRIARIGQRSTTRHLLLYAVVTASCADLVVVQGWTLPHGTSHRPCVTGRRIRRPAHLLWVSPPTFKDQSTTTEPLNGFATKGDQKKKNDDEDDSKDNITGEDCNTCEFVILMDPDAVVTDSMPIVYYDGPMSRSKEQVSKYLAEPIVEVIMCSLVLLSCILVAIKTLPDLHGTASDQFVGYLLNTVGLVFVADFGARWFAAPSMKQHALRPQFFIEVLAVICPLILGWTPQSVWTNTPIPRWLTSPGSLINLELLRVARLQRILKDMDTFRKFEIALGLAESGISEWQLQLARVFTSLFTLLSISTGFIYTAEHEANPAFTDYFTALYFGLTTLTTVGFGDITPVTWQGKLVVCGSIIAGVAVVPAQAAALVEALLARQEERTARRSGKKKSSSATTTKETTTTNPVVVDACGDAITTTTTTTTNRRMILDTAFSCSKCGAAMHWSTAQYCYSCGETLSITK